MGDTIKNLGKVASDSRSRILIIFTVAVLTFAVVAGYMTFRAKSISTDGGVSAVSGVPAGLKAIPGAKDSTPQYVKLQTQENIQQAQSALKSGQSYIPTIIGQDQIGSGNVVQQTNGGGAGFATLAQQELGGVTKNIWADNLRKGNCNPQSISQAQVSGMSLQAIRGICPCDKMAAANVPMTQLVSLCSCPDLKRMGVSAQQLSKLKLTPQQLHDCGYSVCELRALGYSAAMLRQAGYSDDQLRGGGYPETDIGAATGLPGNVSLAAIKQAGCSVAALQKLRQQGVSASTIRKTSGCSAAALRAAGYSAADLRNAGFSAAELKAAGFSAAELRNAGFSAAELKAAGFSAADLKNAGFSASDLKAAGYSPAELKAAGFSARELKDAGFSAAALKSAGFAPSDLRAAGFTPTDLKNAGYSAAELKNAGYSVRELAEAGYTPAELTKAGFSATQMSAAGITSPTQMIPGGAATAGQDAASAAIRQALERQQRQMNQQQSTQELQAMQARMRSAASPLMSQWSAVNTQAYIDGTPPSANGTAGGSAAGVPGQGGAAQSPIDNTSMAANGGPSIKAGMITYAVMETAANSDEPGPVIARIVAGDLRGARLIGSMTVSANASKGTIQFTQLSLPSQPNVINISAFAIDPKTARTAVASRVDNHYMLRYGSLFASSFLEGVGQAVQQQGTSISTNATSTTIQNNNLSATKNAIIGLGKVGQAWGAQVAPMFARPATIYVYTGSDIGVLFTADTGLPDGALDRQASNVKIVKGM